MSGGVDSSAAAALLKQSGIHTEGISFILFETRGRKAPTSCCSIQAIDEAARTASLIGIKHTVIDARDGFMDKVIIPFVDSYCRGETPNPCILCNKYIKFPLLLAEAKKRGFDAIATGHYARILETGGRKVLYRASDKQKDQSYFLYSLRHEELERLVFPLGEMTKPRVREIAKELGLPVFNRPESQEICFVERHDYAGFVKTVKPECAMPGPIVDKNGNELGRHEGIYLYTIGQRKGLGIPAAGGGEPMYVTGIDADKNTVTVGPKMEAYGRIVKVGDLNLLMDAPKRFNAHVKLRSMMPPAEAVVEIEGDGALVEFSEPQFSPSPGQSAVFYDADAVIGGGVIKGFSM